MRSGLQWRSLPDILKLPDNEVHIWRATLELSPMDLSKLEENLSADERARAARFCFAKDRRHFVAARGVLRNILARYLHRDPDRLEFSYSASGKPTLRSESGVRFNLSHSGGLALYAITHNREIGVDLERGRSDFAWQEVAERFFSPREVDVLRSLPEGTQCDAFFECWTRKEAYLKARGEGLLLGLNTFEVSVDATEVPALLSSEGDAQEALGWSFREFVPEAGYMAALAVKGHEWTLRFWQWPEDSTN
jgi:4'-phosphopantetheinyl transferase